MKYVIYILLLIIVISCEKNNNDHKTIFFENKTNYKVWVAYSLAYPDTITDPSGYLDIDPHSIRTLDEKIGYETLISQNKEHRIILFVKKDDPYVIVKRYILTLDSLNTLSWTITYP
jgi:hypothetical protein